MRRSRRLAITLTAAVTATLAASMLLSRCAADDCHHRGGHIEIVYGGYSGWTCNGATRP